MINNLQIELKRKRLEQEFFELQEQDNLSQQPEVLACQGGGEVNS